jgi:hypothetical protein
MRTATCSLNELGAPAIPLQRFDLRESTVAGLAVSRHRDQI